MFSKALGPDSQHCGTRGEDGGWGWEEGMGRGCEGKKVRTIIQGELQVEMNTKINIYQFPTFQIN